MADLGAILTAIVTPFDDDLNVDEEAFVDLLRHLCAHGSDGVVVCGTTGEAPTLSDEEHLRLIELAAQERPDGATVVAVDGLGVYAGNDDILARTLDIGGVGGICVASHIIGEEMRRMVDEPDARAEIDGALRGVFDAMAVTTNPIPVKA